ncbi:MAG: type II secretion system protein [Nitrospirae bacterium]|nr:type II secretion system protein [Nitrospirota bacterium]
MPDKRYRELNISSLYNGGFTLLEIMIALAIIGIALTTIIYTVNYHSDVAYENTVTTQMYMLAKEKITEMERSPVNSKGDFPDTEFRYVNTAEAIANTDIIELKTIVSGHGKEVLLSELITKKTK